MGLEWPALEIPPLFDMKRMQLKSPLVDVSSARSARRRMNGFTLIELLVVIAIIGILAGILIPAVGKVRERSYEAHAMQNLRSIHAAAMLYVSENRGKLPMALSKRDADGNPSPWDNLWVDAIEPFLPKVNQERGRNPAFYCPKVDPSVDPRRRFIADYAPNTNLMKTDVSRPLAVVKDPARELLFIEAAKNLDDEVTPRNSGAFTAPSTELAKGNFEYPNTVAQRHGSASDPAFYGAFVDGHVERFNLNELADDDERRRTLFSAQQNGNSIY